MGCLSRNVLSEQCGGSQATVGRATQAVREPRGESLSESVAEKSGSEKKELKGTQGQIVLSCRILKCD